MDFQGRYKLLEMLSDGEARTFKALQTSSGRTVLLHQLWQERTPPNQPDLASLVFGFLRRATAEEMKSLVDMGEEAGRVFVVTEDLPGCQDLRQWLQPAPGTPGTAGKASVSKPAPSGDSSAIAATMGLVPHARQEDLASPGPTQLFTNPKVIADQRLSASAEKTASTPTTHPEPPVEPGTLASPAKLAGHLGGVSEAGVLKAAEPPVAPPGPAPASQEAVSEFTRIFFGKDMPAPEAARPVSSPPEKPSAPPAPTAQKPPERQPPAGFEVVYESRKPRPRGPAPPTRKEPLPPPPAPGREEGAPGEFTRIFYGRDEAKAIPPRPEPAAERTRLPSPAPAQPSQSDVSGEFTRLFQALHVKEKPPAAPSVEAKQIRPSAPPVQPTVQKGRDDFMRRSSAVESEGPGEFTRLFHAGPQPARPAGPPIPTSSPKPSGPLSSSSSQQDPGELTQLVQGYKPQKSGPTLPVVERPEPVVPPPPPTADKAKPGAFTLIFQRPSEPTTLPPAAPSPPVVQTPPTAPQSPEPDEFMRMFELPGGGAGAPPQGAPQAPPPAAPQPAAGRAVPVIPMASVSPVAPSMPYVQPPMVPQPQPYQVPAPQLQQPAVPSPYAMPPQPAMPQIQPMAVPVPVAPQAAPPKTDKSKFLVPLIILGGLFLIAVGLILFFALKH
ncbi:MAG: hypothetical protein WCD04_03830 [Terriglobia bacterium]|jgi:hypothetical protein